MRWCAVSSLLVAVALGGCSKEANYTLRLIPYMPDGERVFDGGGEVWVGVRRPDGEDTWESLGELTDSTVEESGFGALADDRIAIAVGGPDGPVEAPESLTAYGETAPLTLDKGNTELNVELLVASMVGVGGLSALDPANLGASVAVLDDGRVYVFGGSSGAASACTNTIRRASNLNTGSWDFLTIPATLEQGTCFSRATPLTISDRPYVLVSGGQPTWSDYERRHSRVTLFNATTEEVVWSVNTELSRARHAVQILDDGRILMVSGSWTVPGTPPAGASAEVIEISEDSVPRLQSVETFAAIPPVEFMTALIPNGIAVCGGGRWSGSTITAEGKCGIVGATGTLSPLPDLPVPIRGGMMTHLSDGRLLLAGGITGASNAGSNATARDAAYVLDLGTAGATWTDVGSLASPRAFATIVADGAGGAVVLGGAPNASGFNSAPPSVPECGERFIPSDVGGSFVPLSGCATAGQGLLPTVAVHPTYGVVTVQGRIPGVPEETGGQAVGIISLGPK
ncbi:MAG: hypothetical protein AB8H79_15370 [Myxococcota bacterium]